MNEWTTVKSSSCYLLQQVGLHTLFIGQFTKLYVPHLIYRAQIPWTKDRQPQIFEIKCLSPPSHFCMVCDFELLVVLCVLTLCRTYVLFAVTTASTLTHFRYPTVRGSASSSITSEQMYTKRRRKQAKEAINCFVSKLTPWRVNVGMNHNLQEQGWNLPCVKIFQVRKKLWYSKQTR